MAATSFDHIQEIEDGVFITKNALVSFNAKTPLTDAKNELLTVNKGNNDFKIVTWGKNNNRPAEYESLIRNNEVAPELLRTKRDILIGLDPDYIAYKKIFKGGEEIFEQVEKPANVDDFFAKNNLSKYFLKGAKNVLTNANIFSEAVRKKRGKKEVDTFKCHESRHVRCEEQDDFGAINNYYYCGDWLNAKKGDVSVSQIAAYNPAIFSNKFMVHSFDDLIHDGYYAAPTWEGASNWMQISQNVAVYHINNMKNGYNIRFHIEVPKDYFYDASSEQASAEQRKKYKDAESRAKRELLDKLDQFLGSEKNAGKSIVTNFTTDRASGKEFGGIRITPINFDMQDERLIKLHDKATQMIIASQGIHPTLANVDTAGKLSSGSEMRNALNIYTLVKTGVQRHLLWEMPLLCLDINGIGPRQTGIYYKFKDFKLTTTDVNATGAVASVQQDGIFNPTPA